MKTRKIISAVLAAVMLLSVCAMAISADVLLIAPAPTKTESKKSIFKQPDSTITPDKDEDYFEDEKEPVTKPTTPGNKPTRPGVDFTKPYIPTTTPPDTVKGQYYTVADAKAEIEKYFNDNTYSTQMTLTESRVFAENCYFYSATPAVVSYNYRTGELVAKSLGTADVYVFSRGGVPLLRLRITVRSHNTYDPDDMADTLTVYPAEWNIPEWKFSSVSATSASGKIYDDVVFKTVFGEDHLAVDGDDGVYMTYGEGVAVVRAYRESDSTVYGDTVIYSGKYNSAVRLGRWYAKDGVFHIREWCYDIASPFTKVTGWIKTEGGMLIPVVSWTSLIRPWEFRYATNLFNNVLGDIIKK